MWEVYKDPIDSKNGYLERAIQSQRGSNVCDWARCITGCYQESDSNYKRGKLVNFRNPFGRLRVINDTEFPVDSDFNPSVQAQRLIAPRQAALNWPSIQPYRKFVIEPCDDGHDQNFLNGGRHLTTLRFTRREAKPERSGANASYPVRRQARQPHANSVA